MNEEYQKSMALVDSKYKELSGIKKKLEQLESDFNATLDFIKTLDDNKQTCERRLANADKLLGLLGSEGDRWRITVEDLNKEIEKLVGDVFIAAASISYMGPFTVRLFYSNCSLGSLQRKVD